MCYIHQREISGLTEDYLLEGLCHREDLCDNNVKGLSCIDTMFLYNQYGHQMHEAQCFGLQISSAFIAS